MTNKPEAPYYPHAAPYPYPVLDAARAMLAALQVAQKLAASGPAPLPPSDPRWAQIADAIVQAEAAGIVAQS